MDLVEADLDDVDALVDRSLDLAREMEAYSHLNELDGTAVERAREGFRARLDGGDADDYLVVHDGETIGFVALREERHPSRRYSRSLRVVDLIVDEDSRGQGHGTAVVERVRELARERGCDHLTVSCEWGNDGARRFYRDAGFRPKQVEYAQPLE